ncbi:MAG TPA: hypothetical protein VKS79_11390 [Gemmataceae bacterium]|nr:hypothetical protein [Gemmataceae bacterium]
MTKSAQKLKKQIIALDHEDRQEILRFLLDLQEFTLRPVEGDEWLAELERRDAEVEAGRMGEKPAKEVLADLRRRRRNESRRPHT